MDKVIGWGIFVAMTVMGLLYLLNQASENAAKREYARAHTIMVKSQATNELLSIMFAYFVIGLLVLAGMGVLAVAVFLIYKHMTIVQNNQVIMQPQQIIVQREVYFLPQLQGSPSSRVIYKQLSNAINDYIQRSIY